MDKKSDVFMINKKIKDDINNISKNDDNYQHKKQKR